MQAWLDAYDALDWPSKDMLLVDNSETAEFFQRWQYRANIVRLELQHEHPNRRIGLSMEFIRQQLLAGYYDHWFCVEADVIVPPETLKEMLKYNPDGRIDWLSHNYPARGKGYESPMSGFGCSLFSRRLVAENDFADCPSDTSTDGWWWHNKIRPQGRRYVSLELWGLLDVRHIDG